jgi:hypothetical protein
VRPGDLFAFVRVPHCHSGEHGTGKLAVAREQVAPAFVLVHIAVAHEALGKRTLVCVGVEVRSSSHPTSTATSTASASAVVPRTITIIAASIIAPTLVRRCVVGRAI